MVTDTLKPDSATLPKSLRQGIIPYANRSFFHQLRKYLRRFSIGTGDPAVNLGGAVRHMFTVQLKHGAVGESVTLQELGVSPDKRGTLRGCELVSLPLM